MLAKFFYGQELFHQDCWIDLVDLGHHSNFGNPGRHGHIGEDVPIAGPGSFISGNTKSDDVDFGPGFAHDFIEALAQERAGLVHTGGVNQNQLRIRTMDDTANGMTRCLGAIRGNRDLLSNQCIGQS